MSKIKRDIPMTKKWFCSNCKTISKLEIGISEEDFKCIKCNKRCLLPIRRL